MTNEIMMDGQPLEVGNEVYSLDRGKGEIVEFDFNKIYQILVKFDNGSLDSFSADFKRNAYCKYRDLYWQKPEITPPPKPKKKIKVWDWFVEWPNGDTNKMCGETEQYARNGVKIAQKIDGTEREVER